MFPLREIIHPLPEISIVDVGASAIEGEQRYSRLLEAGLARVIGFEPNPQQYHALQKRQDPTHQYLPYALGDGQPATLNLYRAPGMASLLEVNMEVLSLFNQFEEWCRLVGQKQVETRRLDDIEEITGMDFLKLDVQGGELAVLKNAREKLKETLFVQTEAAFYPLYKNQPLFADIDIFLRENGFYLHTFERVLTRAFKPITSQKSPAGGLNQVFEADAVYVRQFTEFDKLAPEALVKIAVMAHELYKSYDLAALALKHVDQKNGSDLQPRYLSGLTKK